jgi:hypothetical protein
MVGGGMTTSVLNLLHDHICRRLGSTRPIHRHAQIIDDNLRPFLSQELADFPANTIATTCYHSDFIFEDHDSPLLLSAVWMTFQSP